MLFTHYALSYITLITLLERTLALIQPAHV